MQAGNATLNIAVAGTPVALAVTFAQASYTVPPVVVACPSGGLSSGTADQFVWASGVTTTGFTLGGRRSVAQASFPVAWQAFGQ